MKARNMLAGAAIAAAVALGVTGTAMAHWGDDWGDHGLGPHPGCDWSDHGMGPGMMEPGVAPDPGCDSDDHGMGPYPHDLWDD
jgi:hypothetical protein